MSDELREKVAEELWQAESLRVMGCRRSVPWSEAGPAAHNQWRPLADAVIALVLEEAAKCAEDYEGKGLELGLHTQSGDAYVTRNDIAAAIRALKEKP